MNIIFMGTPEFAVPSLKALIGKHNVLAAVSQPDKQKGRGNKMSLPPVKEAALAEGIPVLQPERIKNKDFFEKLAVYNADIIVVAAYGRILPEKILNLPRYGAVCVHASLLPKYRGAAPIQWAIINGETAAGITIMQMDKGIDTGDIMLREAIPIEADDTGGSLHDKLSILGARMITEALLQIENGTVMRIKQDDALSCYAPMLTKEHGLIDWGKSSDEIINLVRGLNPWPSAYSYYNEEVVKIYAAVKTELSKGAPGEIFVTEGGEIAVKTGDSGIIIKQMQKPGGKRMDSSAYLRGHRVNNGDLFKSLR